MDFCKVTEELWRVYLTAGRKENREALGILAPDCVIIGTGKHEFYTNMEDFALALGEEISERQDISFQIKDFWCEQKELGPDACFVYGGIHIWWESEDQKIHIDMDSRFSLIFRQTDEGWKVVHLHQSLPNKEQMDGEFYPKTLTEQVKLAQKTAEEMAWLAQRDSLTGLINYTTLEGKWPAWSENGGWLFILDLDDFKKTNDTYGHVTGNHVLKEMARILLSNIRSGDIACRMGGDEFLLLCDSLSDETDASHLAARILETVKAADPGDGSWAGVSLGGTAVLPGETLESAINRADKALYSVKNTTKNGYRILCP